ncbi:MAG TPA: hypothetical protein VGL07_16840 [Buttiauxella sp.]|jgi:hypothetical protein
MLITYVLLSIFIAGCALLGFSFDIHAYWLTGLSAALVLIGSTGLAGMLSAATAQVKS